MKKKLIEVALPLEAINAASVRESYIYKGNPSAVHKWWAQRPLAACRAVLFASLVDDPSSLAEEFPTEEAQEKERKRLFGIIEELVKWENSNNERVLEAARKEILKSTDGNPPPVLDPFCGGGSIPLEAQRLGLEAHGSDLNPVAVLITKALIEIPPKFAGQPPVNPESRKNLTHSRKWKGAQGLAEDVRYYGKWMRDEAEKRIGHLYPKANLPDGSEATVIAWLWARTVKCPNPACEIELPLMRSLEVSTKKGRKRWVEPEHIPTQNRLSFRIRAGRPTRNGSVGRRGAECFVCQTPIPLSLIREEGRAGRMFQQLVAMVIDSSSGREYVSPSSEHEQKAKDAKPQSPPATPLPEKALGFRIQSYGVASHAELFTDRQLVAMETLSDLIGQVRSEITRSQPGASEYMSYSDAVATYLAFALSKSADYNCSYVPWYTKEDRPGHLFSKQAIPMVWDFAEISPLSHIGGSFIQSCEIVAGSLEGLPSGVIPGTAQQIDARRLLSVPSLVSTDPPYYDNIGYADLSDFFYVWLKRALAEIYPSLFATILVPKSEEMIASPFRWSGDATAADSFFENSLEQTFNRVREIQPAEFPLTIYYAFKHSERASGDGDGTTSTGWETILAAVIRAGFAINGTWPMRTERGSRSVGIGTNALASSIVLVCRPRIEVETSLTRRDFLRDLKRHMPAAIRLLQDGGIAPVDLRQASIGPGMALFSERATVMEADGSPMFVATALLLINESVDEVLAEQDHSYDEETGWAVTWFEHKGNREGEYGEAEVLSNAKNVSVKGMEIAGVVKAGRGKVRLLERSEMPADWDPVSDRRFTIWEATQHLIRHLQNEGEDSAADLLRRLGPDNGDRARDLAYRLYTISERKGWTDEALAYNSLVVAWPELMKRAAAAVSPDRAQKEMF